MLMASPLTKCHIQGGVRKLGDILPISQCISETVRDTAIVPVEVEYETVP